MLITTRCVSFNEMKRTTGTELEKERGLCCITLVIYGIIPDHPPSLFILSQYHQTFGFVIKIKQRLGNITTKYANTPYSFWFLEGEAEGCCDGFIFRQIRFPWWYKSNRQNDPNIYSLVTHPSDSTITRQSQKTLVDAFHSGKCFILIIYFDIRLCSSAVVNRDCYYISREKSPPKPLWQFSFYLMEE
jgi:hypothetical protein